jgi:exodeoxyribonuclease-3
VNIATFNINSVRLRQESLLNWLKKADIDILALQETKVEDKDFPLAPFAAAGYHAVYKGEKGRNGVALLSRQAAKEVSFGLDGVGEPGEARLIRAVFGDMTLINTYVPQGREAGTAYFQYKLRWLRGMRRYLDTYAKKEQNVVWLGDLNVAPEAVDVYDAQKLAGQVGFHPDEQAALSYSKEWGLSDLFRQKAPAGGQYTFWDYRVPNALKRGLGWRVDHILGTKSVAARVVSAYVAVSLREEDRPSDHAPLVVELDGKN